MLSMVVFSLNSLILGNEKMKMFRVVLIKILVGMVAFFSNFVFGENLLDVVTASGLKIELAVDLNRDGKIQFQSEDNVEHPVDNPDKASAERPFRFWINDDNDVVVDEGLSRLLQYECTSATILAGTCEMDDFITSGESKHLN